MFARSAFVALFALPILALAGGPPAGAITNSCNTGSLNCCNSVQESKDLDGVTKGLLSLLKIDVSKITGQVGVTCTPPTVIGASGTSCSSQPTCCTGNSFNGIVAIGCSPINVNA